MNKIKSKKGSCFIFSIKAGRLSMNKAIPAQLQDSVESNFEILFKNSSDSFTNTLT